MKLATRTVEKVWGRCELPAPFERTYSKPVGEIWFEPPAMLDGLLIKYLFTSEKLSVQVHPGEGQAGPGQPGKEECWLVLDADADARLAIGFRRAVSAEEMRAAARDGSIEELLQWHRVQAGDFFYLPAGTVHAIGPGLTLVEVQQNTDITYRLYDYGRPRELHLDQAMAVAKSEVYADDRRRKGVGHRSIALVEGPFFRLDLCLGAPGEEMASRHAGTVAILPLSGIIAIEGEAIAAGECGVAPALEAVSFRAGAKTLIASMAGG
ncbi:class I mannose-6-phosphate isomerase [Qipengyuania sp. MTN3-11]|uniref:class I mannose-6-phosphate isomerase n=1 Tax=Qipengyuania sp. MTN3-11 TaxID=3056557 RepID=UPI0036F418C3